MEDKGMTKKITCVVDNAAEEGSGLLVQHGLSFWIDTGNKNILFDTGQTESVLSHNLTKLSYHPESVDTLVLSHAHYDHTGGLGYILSNNIRLELYANADIFQPRYSKRNGEYHVIGLRNEQIAAIRGTKLHLSNQPLEIIPGLWTTGEIIFRPEPQGASQHHFIKTHLGWEHDPYRDDLSLVWKHGDGLILICGCCHAGILNTLYHARRVFKESIHTVIGGMHLEGANPAYLAHVVDIFKTEYQDTEFYLNHCTGDTAFSALAAELGPRVNRFPAGSGISL